MFKTPTHILTIEVPLNVDGLRDEFDYNPLSEALKAIMAITKLAADGALCGDVTVSIRESDPPFPPHDGSGPDINPATGDERETTTGPATDDPWDGPDDDPLDAA